jgi:Bacterial protein of unknown function (DUF899)
VARGRAPCSAQHNDARTPAIWTAAQRPRRSFWAIGVRLPTRAALLLVGLLWHSSRGMEQRQLRQDQNPGRIREVGLIHYRGGDLLPVRPRGRTGLSLLHDVSSHPHWDGTEEVALADLDTAVTENVVGGREVKVKVWQREVVEVVGASHVTLVVWAEREGDLAVGGGVEQHGRIIRPCPGVWERRQEAQQLWHNQLARVLLEVVTGVFEAEKELTRRSDELARRRQQLPWVRIGKEYVFDTDEGEQSLRDLFAGRRRAPPCPKYIIRGEEDRHAGQTCTLIWFMLAARGVLSGRSSSFQPDRTGVLPR